MLITMYQWCSKLNKILIIKKRKENRTTVGRIYRASLLNPHKCEKRLTLATLMMSGICR